MEGMQLDPQIAMQTYENLLAQKSIHIAQLEVAVQQLAAENQRLREQIPSDEEVTEDADTGTDG